jgi:hypothetical protein
MNRVEKIPPTIQKYKELLEFLDVESIEAPHDQVIQDPLDALSHLHSMFEKLNVILQSGDFEKALVWHGFIQGVLFTNGQYTLNELKSDNSAE